MPSSIIDKTLVAFTNRSRQQLQKRVVRFANQQPHLRQLFADLAKLFDFTHQETDFLVMLSAMTYEMMRSHYGLERRLPEVSRRQLKDTYELLELEMEDALRADREMEWQQTFIDQHQQSELLSGVFSGMVDAYKNDAENVMSHFRIGVLFLFTLVDTVDQATNESGK